MSQPAKVAVVMRTRNRPLLLRRAIGSVLAQTMADWEMIIVNDGGDGREVEGLVAAVSAHAAGRIRVVHHQRSLGMEAASNAGIAASESELLVTHDDDDSWEPAFLAECVGLLERG